MARADDHVRPQQVAHAAHIRPDILRTPVGQQDLRVDAPQEGHLPGERAREGFGVHAGRPGLQRVQALHARRDQRGQHPVDRATRMQDHLIAVAVALVDERREPRHDEAVKQPGADDQILLGAEIVAEEKTVHLIPGQAKESLVGVVIELADVIRRGLDDFRVRCTSSSGRLPSRTGPSGRDRTGTRSRWRGNAPRRFAAGPGSAPGPGLRGTARGTPRSRAGLRSP